MHIDTHTYIGMQMHIHAYTHMHTHTYAQMCLHIHTYAQISPHTVSGKQSLLLTGPSLYIEPSRLFSFSALKDLYD